MHDYPDNAMPSAPAPAPSLAEFETLAAKAYAGLSEDFRRLCEDLIIRVDDFPSREVVRMMQVGSPYNLLGLFQGVGLPFRPDSGASGLMPNMIWLYRRPILAYWADHDDSLEAIIAHVLVHEIGHHFGFSDDDMEAIEAQAE
ncbi:MAG TPA: metallopeptidase family protein [Pseudolabrys sp.]|nr:metallopeptidase family protein [Pseudolabrys sp.]